jgi:hypothetical protein
VAAVQEKMVRVCDPERVLESVRGATIMDTDSETGVGVTLHLTDGRCLVITGEFVMALMNLQGDRYH